MIPLSLSQNQKKNTNKNLTGIYKVIIKEFPSTLVLYCLKPDGAGPCTTLPLRLNFEP
jgi:hypothetical protein